MYELIKEENGKLVPLNSKIEKIDFYFLNSTKISQNFHWHIMSITFSKGPLNYQ